jgi:hypothetical protein
MFSIHIIKLLSIAIIWIFLGTLLGHPEYSYVSSFFQTCFLFLWSYFGHIMAHYVSESFPLNIINTHVSLHHLKEKTFPKWIDLVSESINNFLGFFSLCIFQYLLGVEWLSTKIILYSAFLYIGIHIFYYTLSKNKYHIQHHSTPNYNYSPELLDILFCTKHESDYEEISMIYELIPAVVSFYAVFFFQTEKVEYLDGAIQLAK